jgi:polysaccharide biosynthesis/export protein
MLESGSYIARAKQNQNEIERNILALESKRKNDAAMDLRAADLDMVRFRKKMDSVVRTMAEIGIAAQRVSTLEKTTTTEYSAVRNVDGVYREIQLEENTPIKAGDIIRVKVVTPTGAVAAVPLPDAQANLSATALK